MSGLFRAAVLFLLLGFLLSLFTFSAAVSLPSPDVIYAASALPPVSHQLRSEADTVLEMLAEPPPDPVIIAEPVPEIPPAAFVSSLVPITGELPLIEPYRYYAYITAEERDGRIILPSLIGCRDTDLFGIGGDNLTVMYDYDWYPLPKGTVYAASFMGEMTENEFRIQPGSTLTLHVSDGMNPEISPLSEPDKTFYLTFDDGPNAKNTLNILDTLDEYGIKATFFTVGSYVDKNPDIIKEIHERGHKIGCHSYTHEYAHIYESPENMMAEVEEWETAVKNALGFVPPERLFRYPGGSTANKNAEVHEALLEAGYRIFDWSALNNDCLLHTRPKNVSEQDFLKKSVTETVTYSLSLRRTPHILLMHDSYRQTAEVLPWVIEYLQSLDCSFATLNERPSGWHY